MELVRGSSGLKVGGFRVQRSAFRVEWLIGWVHPMLGRTCSEGTPILTSSPRRDSKPSHHWFANNSRWASFENLNLLSTASNVFWRCVFSWMFRNSPLAWVPRAGRKAHWGSSQRLQDSSVTHHQIQLEKSTVTNNVLTSLYHTHTLSNTCTLTHTLSLSHTHTQTRKHTLIFSFSFSLSQVGRDAGGDNRGGHADARPP